MNEKISANDFRASLDRRLSGLKGDPRLAERIMVAAEKETPMAKKSMASLAFAVVLICTLVTGALAAVLSAWGIIHFAGKSANTYIPPKYEDSINDEDVTVDTSHVTCTIQQSYYDGRILRVTALIVPKEKTLFISGDTSPIDPVEDLFPNLENKSMRIAEYALIHDDGRMADISLTAGENETYDFYPHDDGSTTIYMECVFDDELAEREVVLKLVYVPILISSEASGVYDSSAREVTLIPMTFHAVNTKKYTCNETLDFPSVGVKVTNVTLIATPLEIRYALHYEITDLNAYAAQEKGLWFEFIHSDGAEAAGAAQIVSDGLRTSGSIGRLDGSHTTPDAVGTVYHQTGSIGLNAIGSQYTIRAYNAWDKARYEALTFDVTEVR